MSRVRLEIESIKILRPKKRWNLYFIVMTEHPTESDKMILSVLPNMPIKLSSRHDNNFSFDTNESHSEGLFVFSKELPPTRELNVHLYLRHSRQNLRDFGSIINDLNSGIGADAFGIVTDIVGTATTPWLVIAKKAIPVVGQILNEIKDRDFGFVSVFERFGAEFESQTEIDRKKQFSGDAELTYSWSLDF